MDFLTDWLTDWLKELLIGGIMGNLEGLTDYVNAQVGEIAVQVGTTPAAWNAGVFSLIRQLSETVILPIAGLVLTFVATYELIQMLLEKNNMHEFDVANIYKWMFKTACAILILSNTFNIVMAVFDVSQSVIAQAGGLIQGSTDITPDMLAELETTLEGMDLGPLLGLWLQSSIIGVTMWALGIVIFVLVYARTLVTISFTLHDNGLLLSVSDDGNGFDKDSLQKAANPYFTGESNHSEHFGLGLYICKLLCEHHNGYLQIRNTVNGANVSAYFKSPTL